jgi:adenylyl- and sulfurtransferase ThiI
MEAERKLGGLFLANTNNTKVNLKNPDITIQIDIKDNRYFVIEQKFD